VDREIKEFETKVQEFLKNDQIEGFYIDDILVVPHIGWEMDNYVAILLNHKHERLIVETDHGRMRLVDDQEAFLGSIERRTRELLLKIERANRSRFRGFKAKDTYSEVVSQWNVELANKYNNDKIEVNLDYYANRIMSNSINVMSIKKSAFNTVNLILNCFLGEKDRSNTEIVELCEHYQVNPVLTNKLKLISNIEVSLDNSESTKNLPEIGLDFLSAWILANHSLKHLINEPPQKGYCLVFSNSSN
jgi:hypothetical protein